MSLVRAMSKRVKRPDFSSFKLERGPSTDPAPAPVKRQLTISRPTLISTTNSLSYDAPDVADVRLQEHRLGLTQILESPDDSSTCSSRPTSSSGDESDLSHGTKASSAPSLSECSTVEDSPSPEPNHLTCYFDTASNRTTGPKERKTSLVVAESPQLPRRAPSHTKKTHEVLARQRSLRVSSSPANRQLSLRASSSSTDTDLRLPVSPTLSKKSSWEDLAETFTMANEHAPHNSVIDHPFGPELERLSEVAEEFGKEIRHVEAEEDISALNLNGLLKFSALDYDLEVDECFWEVYGSAPSIIVV